MTIKVLNIGCNIDPKRLSDDVLIRKIGLDVIESADLCNHDIVVWNNNITLSISILERLRGVKLLVNWGTDDSNLPDLTEFQSRNIEVQTTKGYCTEAVVNFTVKQINERERVIKPNEAIGFIGMGKINYTLARELQRTHNTQIKYNSPLPKEGLHSFDYVGIADILSTCSLIIIAVNHAESLIDYRALSSNPSHPYIINLSKEAVFPLEKLLDLLKLGVLDGFLSDNTLPPKNHPSLAKHYSGHIAYKSASATDHKHFILQSLINRMQAKSVKGNSFSIYVARHGQTNWNKENRLQGRLDSKLTPKGEAQAKRLGEFLNGREIVTIYSSPLGRSIETARTISEHLGIKYEIVDSFVEMHFGILQGKLKSTVHDYPDFLARKHSDKLRTRYPQGESYYDISLRIQKDIDRLIALGENTIIVGHESTNRMIRGVINQMPMDKAVFLKQANNEVVEFQFSSHREITHKY